MAVAGGCRLSRRLSLTAKRHETRGLLGKLAIGILNRTVFRAYPQMYRKYRRMGFTTPSGKVELASRRLQEAGLDALPVYREPLESPLGDHRLGRQYPLVLTTGAKCGCYVHSQMRNVPGLNRQMPYNLAELHPDTARDLGIGDGDAVRVESPGAAVECVARVTEHIRPRVVQLYHGFAEANANLLTDNDVFDPITGSVPLRSSLCRISTNGGQRLNGPT
jgi:anaerobic selenocysteine-containing dehydrogenase